MRRSPGQNKGRPPIGWRARANAEKQKRWRERNRLDNQWQWLKRADLEFVGQTLENAKTGWNKPGDTRWEKIHAAVRKCLAEHAQNLIEMSNDRKWRITIKNYKSIYD